MNTNMGKIRIGEFDSDNCWGYENGFYWFSHPGRINKLLAHYDLYKSILDLPGDVFELGVYKGASFIRLATFRDNLETTHSRRLVGFDAFGSFPLEGLSLDADRAFIEEFEGAGGKGLEQSEIKSLLERKGFSNFELVKGNIKETIPEYLSRNPHTKIALLHLDMDVKEPTLFALEQLFDRVVAGGLIVIDDYNAVAGATEAVDLFLKDSGLSINKLPHYNVPSFIRK